MRLVIFLNAPPPIQHLVFLCRLKDAKNVAFVRRNKIKKETTTLTWGTN